MKYGVIGQIKLIRDNQVILHIASYAIVHEKMKHIKVDCLFVRQNIESGCLPLILSTHQRADILTKYLGGSRIEDIYDKHGTLRSSLRERVKDVVTYLL